MKKSLQNQVNELVLNNIEVMNHEINIEGLKLVGKLRTCNAVVYETTNFYILKSYNTIVAGIHKQDDTLYDFLRYVYGYTSTSAQHIAKFNHDYCNGYWGCKYQYRYY